MADGNVTVDVASISGLDFLLQRLTESGKETKRHAAKAKEWHKARKAKLEAVERAAEKVEEEEEAGLPDLGAGGATAKALGTEEEADEEEDASFLQQVLFQARLMSSSDFCLPEEDALLQACRAMLLQRTQFEALDSSVAFSELVSNYMLVIYYQRHPKCPETTARLLFNAMAYCKDAGLACQANSALLTLCGFRNVASMTGIHDLPPYESKLYGKEVILEVCEWMPGANDFLEALTGLGYRAPGSARPKKTRGTKGANNAAEQPAAYLGPWPQLTHLRLLLRLLVPICRAKAEVGGAGGSAWARLPELSLALLHLMLDPAACHLTLDLQAALQAAIGAFQDSMWERKILELAAGSAAAGCSPAGGLEAIRSIPAACKRGRLLQRHALVALLKRAIPSQEAQATGPRRRGAVADIHVPEELESSPWFRNAKGIASLVADAMEGGAHTLSDVAAALQASHLLVWQHEVEHGKDAFVNNTWPQFLSSLQAQLVKHKQDTFPGLSALKLLVTNFIDFPQATEDELADEDTQG